MKEIDIVDKMLDRLFGDSFIMSSELKAWQTLKTAVLAQQTNNIPKMPSLEQFIAWCTIQGFDLVHSTASYMYIARHLGH